MAAVAAATPVDDRRLFISGIAPNLTRDELVKRLQSYGQITHDLVLNKKNAETTGIFGHCNILLDVNAWQKLRKLSGTVLKGSKLRIEEAKQDWLARRALDNERPQPTVPNRRKRPAPDTIPAVESRRVKRGEIIKDSDITQKSRKQGWIKGRYGRAIAILKTEDGTRLPRNPDALSRLWGSAHPKPEQLTYYYDDEEEEWHDRRGRVIKDVEIAQKRKATEERAGGRVEIWGSDDEGEDGPTVQQSGALDYVPAQSDEEEDNAVDEAMIDAQLQEERSAGLDLLRDMFKDQPQIDETKIQRQEVRRVKDKLDIVQRFDPNAPEEEFDEEVMAEHLTAGSPSAPLPVVDDKDDMSVADRSSVEQGNEENDEDKPVSSSLGPAAGTVNSADLTSIFKLKAQSDNVGFQFSDDESEPDEDNDATMLDAAPVDTQDIHPDRLNRAQEPDVHYDDVEVNPNHTALAKDRGFSMGNVAIKTNPAPAFFMDGPGTHWATQRGLFSATLDRAAIMARLEETRLEATRDWKRREREANKQMRKANNRHG